MNYAYVYIMHAHVDKVSCQLLAMVTQSALYRYRKEIRRVWVPQGSSKLHTIKDVNCVLGHSRLLFW